MKGARSWLPLAISAVLAFPAIAWLLTVEQFLTDDGDIHRWRTWLYWQLWQEGHLPPRWAPDLGYGLGAPVFAYYAPLPYLLGGVAQAWGFSAADATKVVFALALLLGGLGTFLLATAWYARSPNRQWAGLLAGITYLYTPYVLTNVTHRGAIGESLALGVAPWLIWAELRCLQRADRRRGLPLAIAVAAFILAHNLSVIVFGPIAVALIAAWIAGQREAPAKAIRAVARTAMAATVGLALAAFFWLPLIGQMGYVQLDRARVTDDQPKYVEYLFTPAELVTYLPVHDYRLDFTPDKPRLPHLGLVQFGVVVVALAIGVRQRRWRDPVEALLPGGIVVAFFLASPLARPLWDQVVVLATVQFPWRFLGVIALLGAVAAGGIAAPAKRGPVVAAVLSLAIVGAGAWLHVQPREWRGEWESPTNLQRFEQWTRYVGLTADGEFLPVWTHRTPRTLFDPAATDPALAGQPPVEVELVDARPGRWLLAVQASAPAAVVFDAFYFPSWQATVDGQPAPVRPVGDLGFLAVEVPTGTHQVAVAVEATPLERAGLIVSIAAALVIVAAGGQALVRRRSRLVGPVPARALGLVGTAPSTGRVAEAPTRSWGLAIATGVAIVAPFAVAALRPLPPPRYLPVSPTDAPEASVRLIGVRVDQARFVETGQLDLTLLFFAPGEPPPAQPNLHLQLTDATGRVVAESEHPLGQGWRPTTIWQPNQIVADRLSWWLAAGSGGGVHTLHLGIDGGPLHPVLRFTLEPTVVEHPRDALAKPPPHLMLFRQGDDGVYGSSGAWLPARWGETLMLDDAEIARFDEDDRADGHVAASLLVRFSWSHLVDDPARYEAVLRLVDPVGEAWQEVRQPVVFAPGVPFLDQRVLLPIPDNLLPGRYDVELRVRRAEGDWLVRQSNDATGDRSTSVVMWTHEVTTGCDCVPEGGAVVGQPIADGIRLLGYQRRVVGDRLEAIVYWQADATPSRSYTAFIHLLDRDGQLVAQYDDVAFGGTRPTTTWRTGEVVPFAARLRLPTNGGPFRLRAGMYEYPSLEPLRTPDGRAALSLGIVERDAAFTPQGVAFDGGVELVGYRVDREATGDRGTVTLYWRTAERIAETYSVFVHVLDANGTIVGQGDGPPELGERSTTQWPRETIVVDPHPIPIPSDGPLSLRVGLYRVADNARLHRIDGGDAVDLGAIP